MTSLRGEANGKIRKDRLPSHPSGDPAGVDGRRSTQCRRLLSPMDRLPRRRNLVRLRADTDAVGAVRLSRSYRFADRSAFDDAGATRQPAARSPTHRTRGPVTDLDDWLPELCHDV